MPNWCNNDLFITGDKKERQNFIKQAKSAKTDLDFSNFLPTPKELLAVESPNRNLRKAKELTKKYGSPCWYEWHIRNWGVKWDVEAELHDGTARETIYTFYSAWSSPLQFFINVSKMFSKLTFYLVYNEPGMAFEGEFKVKNGKILLDRCEDMKFIECPICHETYWEKDLCYNDCKEGLK